MISWQVWAHRHTSNYAINNASYNLNKPYISPHVLSKFFFNGQVLKMWLLINIAFSLKLAFSVNFITSYMKTYTISLNFSPIRHVKNSFINESGIFSCFL